MNEKKKEIINSFVLKKDEEILTNYNLVLEKLNDFLLPFLDKIIEENKNEISFKLNLIGDHLIESNYDFINSSTIMIEYFTNSEIYNYDKSQEEKSEIGQLISNSFQSKDLVYPTIQNLLNRLYNYLSLNTKDVAIFKRKNGISIKLFDFKFFIFFYNKTKNSDLYNFQIKGKNYSFNFIKMHENLLKKNNETRNGFFNTIKFFKIIERELSLLNKLILPASKTLYFYENLLYSLPNKLFENNFIYDNFIETYNFLNKIYIDEDLDSLKNSEDLSVFVEDEYQLFAKYYITKNDIKLILKQCKIFISNINEIIKD